MGSSSPVLRKLGSPPNKMLARENKTNRKSLNKELEKMRATIKPPSIFPAIEQFFQFFLLDLLFEKVSLLSIDF